MSEDLVTRLRKRAEIRRQISTRKSVQEGKPDRIADLLEEAAQRITALEAENARLRELLGEAARWLRRIAERQDVGFACLEDIDAALSPCVETTTKPNDNRSDRQTDVRLANGSAIRVNTSDPTEVLRATEVSRRCPERVCADWWNCELCASRWTGGEG